MTTETPIQKGEVLTVYGCAQHPRFADTWVLSAQSSFQKEVKDWWLRKPASRTSRTVDIFA